MSGVSVDDIATASSDPQCYGLCAAPESVNIVASLDRNSHGGQRYRATQSQHATAGVSAAPRRPSPPQPSPHPSAQWGEPVNHLPIDPDAHSRRAWLPCPNCNHGHDCPQCQNNQNCQIHWQYLLKTAGTRVSLQCPTCAHLWTVDTTHARRREPDVVATIPLGGHARDVVVSPGGDHVYATTANSAA